MMFLNLSELLSGASFQGELYLPAWLPISIIFGLFLCSEAKGKQKLCVGIWVWIRVACGGGQGEKLNLMPQWPLPICCR